MVISSDGGGGGGGLYAALATNDGPVHALLTSLLAVLLWALASLPGYVVTMAHGLCVCNSLRPTFERSSASLAQNTLGGGAHWLALLVLSVGTCVAGGTVRHILLGQHADWLASDTTIPIYVAAWFFFNRLPPQGFGPHLMAIFPIKVRSGPTSLPMPDADSGG